MSVSKPIKVSLMAVERTVTGSWCDLEWCSGSVWSAALSFWLCKMWWGGVILAWLLQWFASSRGPVASFTWEYAAMQCNALLSISIRKPTQLPWGNWSIPSTQLEAQAADRLSHFYINTDVYYEISLYCNLPLMRPFSSSFGQLLHPWWEQTVSLLNNSHHFHLILSYHGQFSSWIILWKIHLLSLCVMSLERWRMEWWRILNCVCGARDPRVGNVF